MRRCHVLDLERQRDKDRGLHRDPRSRVREDVQRDHEQRHRGDTRTRRFDDGHCRHILPEQIAHKRNHPQFEAIRTLCLLSLVFGGLLWPFAWIWAYSKPVLHKMAYGTDKLHEDEHEAEVEPAVAGGLNLRHRTLGLQERLARLEAQNIPDAELSKLRADLDAIESKFASHGAR